MKTVLALLIAVLLLGSLAGCAVEERLERFEDQVEGRMDAAENAVENVLFAASQDIVDPKKTAQLTAAQAEEIALDYVSLTADQVSRLHTEYEIDDGMAQYDVQFYQDGWEYEFEIHAETGAILSYDRDH